MADKKRRRSFRNVFKRPDTPPSTPSLPSGPSSPVERRSDLSAASPVDTENLSPRIRPRTLQKANRSSIFGSLRSLQSLDEDERTNLTRTDSKTSSLNEDGFLSSKSWVGETIVRHGEVTFAGGTRFRKRNHYLVLTESHLVRFKNETKAVEFFPSLVPSARPSIPRSSVSSVGSLTDIHLSTRSDITQGASLDQVVAVYKVDDARAYVVVEIVYLEERLSKAGCMQLQFNDAAEAISWISIIRTTAAHARNFVEQSAVSQMLDHVARVLSSQGDYDATHFRAFQAVQLAPSKPMGRSSSDDLAKYNTSVCHVAIGVNKMHFIPVPKTSTRSSTTSLTEFEKPVCFAIASLSAVKLKSVNEIFEITFKSPTGQISHIALASCHAEEIVLWLRFASEYIRPEWTIQPFIFDVPADVDEKMIAPDFPPEPLNYFDRTLIAYCAAYAVDVNRLAYTVIFEGEDAPCFQLLPPVGYHTYSSMELLAVMRALRYNECFTSISFADIDLRPLRDFYDPSGSDIDCQSTRSGTHVNLPGHSSLSVLSQELRALALKSRRLRRFDFTNAMSKSVAVEDEQCCGIPVALTPLCKRSLTNVDWVILNGIQLGEADLNHLVDAASERRCHLRALEVAECGLSIHDVSVLLSTLAVHEDTLEVINIAGAQGRFSPELLQRDISIFSHIRKLNLTRIQKTAGPEHLLSLEVLLGWRLECLYLGQIAANEQLLDSISGYLKSPKSDTMRELHVNQSGLTGTHLASLLRAMTRRPGEAREMHVNASENKLNIGSTHLAKSLAENCGPASLNIRMMDFEKEQDFRELIRALMTNTTLRSLDISRVTLPYDASEETSKALKDMFAGNQMLNELDISGEHAHLDSARFGIGLNIALQGLQDNKVLRLLRIEHQSLGLQGASTLAAVLESNNSLVEIHCEHNEINLQSFTVLVNAMRRNTTLLYMPDLSSDKAKSLLKIEEEFRQTDGAGNGQSRGPGKHNALIKGLTALSHRALPRHSNGHGHSYSHSHSQSYSGSLHRKSSSMASNFSFTDQDVAATLAALEERWQTQQGRLQIYLTRNYNIAAGVPIPELQAMELEVGSGDSAGSPARPDTANSLSRILAQVKMERTPTVEKPSMLDDALETTSRDAMFSMNVPPSHGTYPNHNQDQIPLQSATDGTLQSTNLQRKSFVFELPDAEEEDEDDKIHRD